VSQTVRVIIVNTDEGVAPDLRQVLSSVDGVRIVAEVDEPVLLPQALEQFPAEVLLIHLDPSPDAIMDIATPLIEEHKSDIAAIAMTENRDAQLVMRAMRAGMREFLWKPFPPEQLAEILQRVGGEAAATGNRQHGRLVTVVGTGGGVGTTQLVTNVGAELSQFEHWDQQPRPGVKPRVALVDLDFRLGQVAVQLDAQPTYTIAELCDSPEQIDQQMIERAMYKHPVGIDVLARPVDFTQADAISAGQCASALAALQEHYDFILTDMPARFDPTARAVFDIADTYLLVLQLMVPCVRTADRILQELSGSGYSTSRVRIVCNRCGRDSGFLDQTDVENTLKRKVDYPIPNDWKTSATAVNMGAPLLTSAPKSKLRQAYLEIALSLAGTGERTEEKSEDSNGEAKKGVFSFLSGAKS